jgi:hypothetical protein
VSTFCPESSFLVDSSPSGAAPLVEEESILLLNSTLPNELQNQLLAATHLDEGQH